MLKRKINIVIIDSGVSAHKDIKDNFNGVHFHLIDNEIVTDNDISDHIGHGTAITFLVNKYLPEANVFCIKIYDNEYCNPALLVKALDYVDKNIACDVVNISLGAVSVDDLSELREKCDSLNRKGTIVVSAFDNNGTLSYPAAFSSVIGVDVSIKCGNVFDYQYVENSQINIRAYHREQRLPWIGNEYRMVSGASFAAPYITIIIAKMISEGITSPDEINAALKKSAQSVICCKKTLRQETFMPQKAVVFPFNKEIHSIARDADRVSFKIEGFYDSKYVGNIGKHASEIIGGTCNIEYEIRDYLKIDWSGDFDTVILGHTRELASAVGFDYQKYFIDKCLEYKKFLYSFDCIDDLYVKAFKDSRLNVFYPKITEGDVPKNDFGKLRKIGKPVVAIVGTGPRQGKFTLQLGMRNVLEYSGYRVGMLGTEPTSLLLGFDAVYPMGYYTTVGVSGTDAVRTVNRLIASIEDKNPEIIIVGSQSQSVPFITGSLKYYPVSQHEFLLGTMPDCCVLCINISDDIDYINRTVNYIENFFVSRVIALAALPLDHANKWSVINNKKIPIDEEDLRARIGAIESAMDLKVYDISSIDDIAMLTEQVVDFFA